MNVSVFGLGYVGSVSAASWGGAAPPPRGREGQTGHRGGGQGGVV
jgi:hypothetical protein